MRAIGPHLPVAKQVLDPCAGDGAIVRALRASLSLASFTAFEIDAGRAASIAGEDAHATAIDALAMPAGVWGAPDLIATNPPYGLALPFVERALAEVAPGGTVAMLLRLGWAEGQRRVAFHHAHPADLFVLPRRPSFTGRGTDATAYAWWLWGPGRGGRWQVIDLPSDGLAA